MSATTGEAPGWYELASRHKIPGDWDRGSQRGRFRPRDLEGKEIKESKYREPRMMKPSGDLRTDSVEGKWGGGGEGIEATLQPRAGIPAAALLWFIPRNKNTLPRREPIARVRHLSAGPERSTCQPAALAGEDIHLPQTTANEFDAKQL